MVMTREEMKEMYGSSLRGSYTGCFLSDDYLERLVKSSSAPNSINIFMDAVEGFVSGCFPSRGFFGNPRKELEKRENLFNSLNDVSKKVLVSFYEGEQISGPELAKQLLPFIRDYPGYYLKMDGQRNRFLNDYSLDCLNFIHKLIEDTELKKCDHISFIADGGIQPALLASHYFGIKEITPVCYSVHKMRDQNPCLPFWLFDSGLEDRIGGKKILLVDDALASGDSSNVVTDYLIKNGAESVEFRYVVKV